MRKENKNIELIESELYKVYRKYFEWFSQRKFLQKGIKTSHPFFINIKSQLGKNSMYFDSKDTILVYGQETYGFPSKNWSSHPDIVDKGIGEAFSNKNTIEDAIYLGDICSNGFDFPYFRENKVKEFDNKNQTNIIAHFRGPFGRLLRDIGNKNRNILWSNMLKFDVFRPNHPKRRIKKGYILKDHRKDFVEYHKDLILSEIDIIKPKIVLFLSSPNEQGSIYNEIIQDFLSYSTDDFLEYMKVGQIEGKNIAFIQSYHPRRLNIDEQEKLVKLL